MSEEQSTESQEVGEGVNARLAAIEKSIAKLTEIVTGIASRLDEHGDDEERKGKKSATLPKPRPASPAAPHKQSGAASPGASLKTPSTTKSPASPSITPTSPTSSGEKKQLKPKVTEPKKPKDDKKETPKNSYFVGKRKIFYELPTLYRDKDPKKIPSNLTTTLTLDFAYGLNGRLRNSVFYNDVGHFVYVLAGVGVVYDHATKEQKFFFGHNDDISSIAMHPKRHIVATGQVDPKGKQKPYVCIWDSKTMKEFCRLENFHDRGVCAIAFSPDGSYIATIGDDDSHTMGIWKWEEKPSEPFLQSMVSKGEVYGVVFNSFRNPAKPEEKDDEPLDKKIDAPVFLEFVTFGAKQAKFFTIYRHEKDAEHPYQLTNRLATSGQHAATQKSYPCALYLDKHHCIIGTEGGELYVFKGQQFKQQIKCHETGLVGAICATGDGFATAGYDFKVRVYTPDLKEKLNVDLTSLGVVKAHSITYFNGKLAVGLANNHIVEIQSDTSKHDVIMTGHRGEIWALAVHPTKPLILTGAMDNMVRLWDYSKKCFVPSKSVKSKTYVRSAAFHPNGDSFALGCKDGTVLLHETESFNKIKSIKRHTEEVDCIAYSPDGKHLATGSWDQTADIIDATTNTVLFTLKGHSSSVTHLCWSGNSQYLMTNSKDYEILYWIAATGKRGREPDVVDLDWGSWNCILGWPVVGIFQAGEDGTDVNSCSVSGDSKQEYRVIATGDDNQNVCLFRYPALNAKVAPKVFTGHSSHVTRVRFSPDGSMLFTTGGDDAIFQWKHVPA